MILPAILFGIMASLMIKAYCAENSVDIYRVIKAGQYLVLSKTEAIGGPGAWTPMHTSSSSVSHSKWKLGLKDRCEKGDLHVHIRNGCFYVITKRIQRIFIHIRPRLDEEDAYDIWLSSTGQFNIELHGGIFTYDKYQLSTHNDAGISWSPKGLSDASNSGWAVVRIGSYFKKEDQRQILEEKKHADESKSTNSKASGLPWLVSYVIGFLYSSVSTK